MIHTDGTSIDEASSKFYLIDKHGLIKSSLGDMIREGLDAAFIRKNDEDGGWGEGEATLEDVVKKVKPTVLIGTSTHAGAFTVGRQISVMVLFLLITRCD